MKIGGLVHARMTSERLPGKGLADIRGKPALAYLFERLAASKYLTIETIVLCIPDTSANEPLAEFAASVGVNVHRGSENDLIERFAGAVAAYGYDAVIQADGDDICIDPFYADLAMDTLLENESVDIVLSRGLPLSVNTKAIRARAIENVHRHYLPADNGSGAFLYFTETPLCVVHEIHALSPDHVHERARLTLDYPEDLAFFEAFFEALERKGVASPASLGEIVQLLRERPELIEINAFRNDEYWDRSNEVITGERLRYRTENGIQEVEVRTDAPLWFNRRVPAGGERVADD